MLFTLVTFARTPLTAGAAGDGISDLQQLRGEIEQLRDDERSERDRVKHDEQIIRDLEDQLRKLQAPGAERKVATQEPAANAAGKQTDSQPPQGSEAHPSAAVFQPAEFEESMNRYLGQHQFTLVGAAAGDFVYDRQTNRNTFALTFEPIALYRLNDWILFEGTIESSLPPGSAAEFALPVATAQFFLNDYVEINAGIFDQPFGDWYEDQSPVWVNRFITAPLMYGAEAIIPPTDIGIQLRGSRQWGALGQDADYTLWVANGPSFDSALPRPAVGQTLNPQTNIALNANGRTYGTRTRVYPLPLDAGLGRLELGASTYDGKWLDGLWFNSWGVDFAYLNGNLQARGEFAETYRQMPAGSGADNRQGWYVQAGYFLQGLPASGLSDQLDILTHRLEVLARYSAVNQRAVVADEFSSIPGLGFNGSPAVFAPHAREVALGIDYWLAPSIVWQLEFDLELPQAGGTILSFGGGQTPAAKPAGPIPNDEALLTQFAIGF